MSVPPFYATNLCRFHSNRLYAKSSYLSGLASLFNIAGNYCKFNYSGTPEEADFKALMSDWGVTSEDLQRAINLISEKYGIHVDTPSTTKPSSSTTTDAATQRELACAAK
jgi:hypothetical protein